MPRRIKQPKRHVPDAAELENDPSLKWCGYRRWETLWSDSHGCELRFHGYERGKVRLASLDGMAPLPGLVPAASVHRLTAAKGYRPASEGGMP